MNPLPDCQHRSPAPVKPGLFGCAISAGTIPRHCTPAECADCPRATSRRTPPLACIHRSRDPHRLAECDSCGERVRIKVFHCERLAGECTFVPLPGVPHNCRGCNFRQLQRPAPADPPLPFRSGDYRNSTVLYNRDLYPVQLANIFRGSSCFVLAAGPSLADMPLELLNRRGVLTLGLNNSPAVFRPHLWVCADGAGRWIEQLWRDPAVWKFVPVRQFGSRFRVRNATGELVRSRETVGQMPAVFGYERNARFHPGQFLTEPSFNWGCSDAIADPAGIRGSTSVFYVPFKLLYYLGVRTIYLLGADFRMREGSRNYAFPQATTQARVRSNNTLYRVLDRRLAMLRPYFDAAGLKVFNCTPDSGLTAFPRLDFAEAVERAAAPCAAPIDTRGMYEPEPGITLESLEQLRT